MASKEVPVSYEVGDLVWAQDQFKHWSLATILSKKNNSARVHFVGFVRENDENISIPDQIRPCQPKKLQVNNGKYRCTVGVTEITDINQPPQRIMSTPVHHEWLATLVKRVAETHDTEVRFISTLNDNIPITIKANKWLLSCQSQYFATRYQSEFADSKARCVDVCFDYTTDSVVHAWNWYMNHGTLPTPIHHYMAELYQMADMLQCETLIKYLENVDFSEFKAADIMKVFEQAERLSPLHPSLKSWIGACVFYATRHMESLLNEADEQQVYIVKRIRDQCGEFTEEDWWELLEPWIHKHCRPDDTQDQDKACLLVRDLIKFDRLPAKLIVYSPLLSHAMLRFGKIQELMASVKVYCESMDDGPEVPEES
jgi:hypothetical protein